MGKKKNKYGGAKAQTQHGDSDTDRHRRANPKWGVPAWKIAAGVQERSGTGHERKGTTGGKRKNRNQKHAHRGRKKS